MVNGGGQGSRNNCGCLQLHLVMPPAGNGPRHVDHCYMLTSVTQCCTADQNACMHAVQPAHLFAEVDGAASFAVVLTQWALCLKAAQGSAGRILQA
jgi:hypothetical protein